jgi:hypothetical protein
MHINGSQGLEGERKKNLRLLSEETRDNQPNGALDGNIRAEQTQDKAQVWRH